jgi:uncharacterized membrane protein
VTLQNRETKPVSRRFWEIDTARGIAVVLMVFFHLMWDLSFFGAYSRSMMATPWRIFARSIGTTFIFLMGLSLTLTYSRLRPRMGSWQLFKKYLLRGAMIFGWGMVITVVTYFVLGRGFVVFGILHLLGLSTILAYPFLRWRWVSLGTGIGIIVLGFYANDVMSLSPWLLWLGVKQMGRYMVDYYPLIPWFGVALLGVFCGFTLYPEGIPRFDLPDLSSRLPVRGLTFLGRHSLVIYLIHQPIILAILVLVGIGSI